MSGRKSKVVVDGLSPKDIARIRSAIREVWRWSTPRKLCIARSTDAEGFVYCENPKCPSKGKPVPKTFIDHIEPVGDVDEGFIKRLFCPSTGLQALCKKCHDAKTKEERKAKKKEKKK